MPTVDERAREMLRKHVPWYSMTDAEIEHGCSVLAREAVAALTSALDQLDEARAVALEEAAIAIETQKVSAPFAERDPNLAASINRAIDRLATIVRALNIKEDGR